MQTEENKKIMARNIKMHMEQKGVTNQQLCEDLGFKYTTFLDWIKAVTYPRIGKIEAMADYFGILKSDLIEEKLTEEKEKDNDIMADIIVRMRTDEEFFNLVNSIYVLGSADIKRYQAVLNALSE